MKIRTIVTIGIIIIIALNLGFFTFFPLQKECREEIDVKLKWVHQAQFAGMYVAAEKGFYEDEGLKVNLIPYDLKTTSIEDVINGDVVFGVGGAEHLLQSKVKDKSIKAFSVIYQLNPACMISLKDSGITKPEDLIGKTVGLRKGSTSTELYKTMMAVLDLDRSKIDEMEIAWDIDNLIDGITAAEGAYIINEPHKLIKAGYDVNIMLMADYEVSMYSDVLFARTDTLEKRPELVEKFLRATLKGWNYALKERNQEEVVDIVLKYAPESTKNHETYMLKASVPLIAPEGARVGWMEKDRWEESQKILLKGSLNSREEIKKKAEQVAEEVEDYIKVHPGMTIDELRDDDKFRAIAIQKVGETGYSGLSDSKTGLALIHPNPNTEGKVGIKELEDDFLELADILKGTVGETCTDSAGFYSYWDTEGLLRNKYISIVCIGTETADGISSYVFAAAHLDEFKPIILEKEIDIEEAYTMEFLERIYG